jgi:tetratricopeptide (TPR) repeat protein
MLTLTPKPSAGNARRIAESLARGIAHHTAGDLAAAEACYCEILQVEPAHPDALHLLGVAAQERGEYGLAVRSIRSAIAQNPRCAVYHNNLGNTYRLQGDFAGAIASYQQAIALDPQNLDALHSLANSLADNGDLAEAETCFLRLLLAQPEHPDALYNLANAKLKQGDFAAAIDRYRQAIQLRPGCAAYHFNLAHALQHTGALPDAADEYQAAARIEPNDFGATYNLGIVLHEQKEFARAADAFRRALELKPELPEAMSNLAAALQGLDDYDGAADLLQRAIALNPNFAEAHGNWGGHLWRQGDLTGAMASCQRAIELNPNLSGAHGNLGHALFDRGDYAGALDCYDRALALKREAPNASGAPGVRETQARPWKRGDLQNAFDSGHNISPDVAIGEYCRAHATKASSVELLYYVGLLHLLHGDFAAGWHNYEYRWQTKMLRSARRDFSQPLWQGEPLEGARILLHAEQGLGDAIQFLRYVPMVAARGAKVVLEVPAELRRLAGTIEGAAEIVTRGTRLPDFQWQSPLMTLPRAFRTELHSIPANVPYLRADAALTQQFAEHFSSQPASSQPVTGGLRIGLVWSGSPRHTRDPQRSLSLAQLRALTEIPHTTFYSLQKGPTAKQLLDMPMEMNLIDLAPQLNDFADTAAALANLDLLVTVDTGVAHLAGALGKPVWIMLTHNPDWRWLLDRDDSPWYPTARLFRQPAASDWTSVIDRVHAELNKLTFTPPQNSSSRRWHN